MIILPNDPVHAGQSGLGNLSALGSAFSMKHQKLHFNLLIACRRAGTFQRQTAFLCLIGLGLADEDGIIHDQVGEAHVDDDNPLLTPIMLAMPTQA